ncbi:hypothetical protein MIR68_007736 [Amoeboaphelidium protococcarum]|nr:hypothetical protein MIR68_007736 [Amoeboaphelidium protococcarum]
MFRVQKRFQSTNGPQSVLNDIASSFQNTITNMQASVSAEMQSSYGAVAQSLAEMGQLLNSSSLLIGGAGLCIASLPVLLGARKYHGAINRYHDYDSWYKMSQYAQSGEKIKLTIPDRVLKFSQWIADPKRKHVLKNSGMETDYNKVIMPYTIVQWATPFAANLVISAGCRWMSDANAADLVSFTSVGGSPVYFAASALIMWNNIQLLNRIKMQEEALPVLKTFYGAFGLVSVLMAQSYYANALFMATYALTESMWHRALYKSPRMARVVGRSLNVPLLKDFQAEKVPIVPLKSSLQLLKEAFQYNKSAQVIKY